MTIPEAIEKAIAGGWKPEFLGDHFYFETSDAEAKLLTGSVALSRQDHGAVPEERIFLDPAFWSALGKSEGWEVGVTYRQSVPARKGPRGQSYPAVIRMQRTAPRPNEWKKKMHALIDALISGKSVEDYFAGL